MHRNNLKRHIPRKIENGTPSEIEHHSNTAQEPARPQETENLKAQSTKSQTKTENVKEHPIKNQSQTKPTSTQQINKINKAATLLEASNRPMVGKAGVKSIRDQKKLTRDVMRNGIASRAHLARAAKYKKGDNVPLNFNS